MGREMTDNDITGEWISGTFVPESLIPTFVDAAQRAIEWQTGKDKVPAAELEKASREVEKIARASTSEKYFAEDPNFDLGVLDRILNEVSPEGYWWGAHEGDGASFGFWEHSAEATS